MWKLLFQSVPGTSHQRCDQPCQDSCLAVEKQTAFGIVLVLACADGAGSARHADVGAQRTCQYMTRLILEDLDAGLRAENIDQDTMRYWYQATHNYLEKEAALLQCGARDLATTVLLAVVGESAAAFSQLGDGAIVVREGETYHTAFWPQSGEYANMTNFLTDVNFAEFVVFQQRAGRVDELALFTDGLQRLTLNFGTKTVHQPFFEPMFRQLRAASSGEELEAHLRQYLDSSPINQRTDDDKTLILATRVEPDDAPKHLL